MKCTRLKQLRGSAESELPPEDKKDAMHLMDTSKDASPQCTVALTRDPLKKYGVFASQDILSKQFVTFYSGKLITDEEVREHPEPDYIFSIQNKNNCTHIDAYNTNGISRFFNDSITQGLANLVVRTMLTPSNTTIPYFVTSRYIKAGGRVNLLLWKKKRPRIFPLEKSWQQNKIWPTANF